MEPPPSPTNIHNPEAARAAPSRLVRDLGPWMAGAVVVGTVIGSGVFQKPQVVAANIPYFGLTALVWILGGLLALLGALAYAEVATLFPRAGGNYVFLREGYGRMAGFLWGWVEFFIIRSASLAALATLFAKSLNAILSEFLGQPVFGYWGQRWVTVAVIAALAWVNIRGVRWGGVLQLLITFIKVASLVGIAVLPLVFFLGAEPSAPPLVSSSNLSPVWPEVSSLGPALLAGFATSLLAVLWAYHGWMNIAPVAEEVKDPQRNIPLSLIGGVGVLIALYLGANLAYSLVLTTEEMAEMKQGRAAAVQTEGGNPAAQDETVAIGFSRRLLGSVGVTLAALAIMFSVFGALNGNILVGPRLLYAMSQDSLAPSLLGEVHAVYKTPVPAIVVLAAWSGILVVGVAALSGVGLFPADKDPFDVLTDFAMFGAVIFETMAVLSIFVFRRLYPKADRPYRCWGYPIVPLLYAFLPALILGNMFLHQQGEAMMGVGFIVSGALVYWLFGLAKTGPVAAGPNPE